MAVSLKFNDELGVPRTSYDRSAAKVGIVHLGYGTFHRAHQAVYFDDYMEITGDLNWGIAAVNLRPEDSEPFVRAQKANGGYLLKTTTPSGENSLRLVRSHLGFTDWSKDRSVAEQLLSQESVHGITITITESGYCLDHGGALNFDEPILQGEISGHPPRSVYAYLASALEQRAQAIDAPISVLCCDNIRANGRMLKSNFRIYLEATDRLDLAEWVEKKVTFPNSMVDRITPRVTDELIQETDAMFSGKALSPIHSESFTQWVLENRFANSMADLTQVGVEVVGQVDAFEEAKIRILNGGHSGLAYFGALAGHKTFDQTINDPTLRSYFEAWQRQEVLPGLAINLPFDKYAYLDQVTERFQNAAITDQLERICMDGWSKIPIYIKPTLESCLNQGKIPHNGYKVVASWYVYSRRFSAGMMPIRYHEPYWDLLEPLLAPKQEESFAKCTQLWTTMPSDFPDFVPGLVRAIKEVERQWPV